MKISVLLAAYNGQSYIIEQLDSLYKQTRKPDEVIIIDDCSTDKTVVLVKEYIEEKKLGDSWKVIINDENKGWRKNFHEGIPLTSGNIIFFSDQDDVWLENKINVMSKLFERENEVNVITSDKIFFEGNLPNIKKALNVESEKIVIAEKQKKMLIMTGGSTMAFRRDYYEKVKGFYTSEMAHDDFFWKISVADGTLMLIKDPLIFRRIHSENASLSKRNREMSLEMLDKQILTSKNIFNYLEVCSNKIDNIDYRKKVVDRYIEGTKARYEMIKKGKIMLLKKILPYYKDIYFNFRTFIGDIILTLYPNWRQ